MTAKTEEQDEPYDIERFRYELALRIDRFIAQHLEAWISCENGLCRRARRCASPDCECIAKWSESLPPLSPEEGRAHLIDFKKALEVRIRLGGETVDPEQLAEAIRNEKAARRAADAATTRHARDCRGGDEACAGEAGADRRAGNDDVKEQDRARDPGPRIARL